jgi:hypothetical protein
MKFLSLVAVVAIVYFVYGKRLAPDNNQSVNHAMSEFDKTAPANAGSTAASGAQASGAPTQTSAQPQSTSNIRRPIDRTRAVLEQVKARNGNGEF